MMYSQYHLSYSQYWLIYIVEYLVKNKFHIITSGGYFHLSGIKVGSVQNAVVLKFNACGMKENQRVVVAIMAEQSLRDKSRSTSGNDLDQVLNWIVMVVNL